MLKECSTCHSHHCTIVEMTNGIEQKEFVRTKEDILKKHYQPL